MAQGGGLSPEQMDALRQIAVQTNQGLSQVAQAISKIDPAVADQLAQLQKAFQEMVMSALNGGSSEAPAHSGMGERPAHAGMADVRPAQ